MYAFKDPLPYAYVLILVLPSNLIPIYLFYNFYLNLKNFLVSVTGAFRIHVKSEIDNGSALEGEKTVLLIEYSTEVLEVFQNFITLKSFSLQIHAKTKYKTSKKLKR